MKRVFFAFGTLFIIACSKTESNNITSNPTSTQPVVLTEENIKFTSNIDSGYFLSNDTLPISITVSSKAPSAGFIYSI